MSRRANVELFEEIRREYEFGVGTIEPGRWLCFLIPWPSGSLSCNLLWMSVT